MFPVHASVQWAAVRITTFSASLWRRLPLQLTRAVFVDSTTPRTDATFGYSLFTSWRPHVIALTPDDTPRASVPMTNKVSSRVLTIEPPVVNDGATAVVTETVVLVT